MKIEDVGYIYYIGLFLNHQGCYPFSAPNQLSIFSHLRAVFQPTSFTYNLIIFQPAAIHFIFIDQPRSAMNITKPGLPVRHMVYAKNCKVLYREPKMSSKF